jgi:predicted amidohydrolase YtcJ
MAKKADIVIENAKVFTSNEAMPHAEAVAVKGNRIVFVGTNEGANEFKGESTRVINGQGRTLTAGFIDSHFHLLWGAIWSGAAQLYEVKDLNDLKTVLLEFAEKNKTSEWVEGRGIKYGIASNPPTAWMRSSPTARFTSTLMTGTPHGRTPRRWKWRASSSRAWKRMGSGSSSAMRMELPQGNCAKPQQIWSPDLIPLPSEARKRELLKMTMQRMNAAGVTSVHNMNGDMEELMTFAAVEDAGEMTVRVYEPYHIKPETTEDMLPKPLRWQSEG